MALPRAALARASLSTKLSSSLNGTTTSTIREGLLVCCWLDTPGRSFGDFPGQIVFDGFPRLPPAHADLDAVPGLTEPCDDVLLGAFQTAALLPLQLDVQPVEPLPLGMWYMTRCGACRE